MTENSRQTTKLLTVLGPKDFTNFEGSEHPRATYKKKVQCGFKELNESIEPFMFFKYFDVRNAAELEVLIWLWNPFILEVLRRLYVLR